MARPHSFVRFSVSHPRNVVTLTGIIALLIVLLAGLPSIWPGAFPSLHALKVDTDPENMLPQDEAVRIFHNRMKKELSIHDMVVVGIVNNDHPDGVFNIHSLTNIHALSEFAKTLNWPDEQDPAQRVGVIEVEMLTPSTLDNIEQDGLGNVRFDWLMPVPPMTPEESLAVRDRAQRIPFLNGTVISENAKAVALYLPLTSKELTYRVYNALQEKISTLQGDDRYYLTGLPVAEDNFGVEMFIQMAISAPLAMLIIFLLMLFFFRKLVLVVSPMLVAMVSVMCTMGLLIATGNTVHIMSSMIPIFIMPIAVLDSVHILSQFFDRYQETKNRRITIENVMNDLYTPMLYTSLTTAAGFASLALAPIPPVQIFGLFVAFGVMLAWFLTITFIPAFIMLIPESKLEDFGMPGGRGGPSRNHFMSVLLHWIGNKTYRWAKPLLALTLLVSIGAIYGIGQIVINDNPIRWFNEDHPIRVADRMLNQNFGGSYMAYLTLAPAVQEGAVETMAMELTHRLAVRREILLKKMPQAGPVFDEIKMELSTLGQGALTADSLLDRLENLIEARMENVSSASLGAWDEVMNFIEEERQQRLIFKQPAALAYIEGLQQHLRGREVVGKSNSLADIVKTVHRELFLGEAEQFKIPQTAAAVAQTLLTFQNSHRPQDLWHFVTPDFRRTSIWIQMHSGDNRDMSGVVDEVNRYILENPPPFALQQQWFGLTYINVVWQERMVSGMLEAFLGSFLVVFLMMLLLLRSGIWAILSMVPLTLTIGSIYGLIGLVGKDYDMPVAVLSALSLGLAVDFAIHFLVQSRAKAAEYGSWREAVGPAFGAPARAITRNGLVISIGFLPLLLAPLVPYQTVGMLIAAILFASGGVTLVVLPALMRLLEPWLFPQNERSRMSCQFMTCILAATALIGLIFVNLHEFVGLSWGTMAWWLVAAVMSALLLCGSTRRWNSTRAEELENSAGLEKNSER